MIRKRIEECPVPQLLEGIEEREWRHALRGIHESWRCAGILKGEMDDEQWEAVLIADTFYYTAWITAGHEHFDKDAFKTGVTRKVKVPK